ncbi:hypothetical protein E2C01_067555 [Portunus trituberculatus]|uniref:Uncharacterized protein n=1 Tax=Portunus trituberculatus TaxID=210409 RepID=A0A5B7HSY7_PORTR|nr:hypothetical protein [Portunus trituberculatus]
MTRSRILQEPRPHGRHTCCASRWRDFKGKQRSQWGQMHLLNRCLPPYQTMTKAGVKGHTGSTTSKQHYFSPLNFTNAKLNYNLPPSFKVIRQKMRNNQLNTITWKLSSGVISFRFDAPRVKKVSSNCLKWNGEARN